GAAADAPVADPHARGRPRRRGPAFGRAPSPRRPPDRAGGRRARAHAHRLTVRAGPPEPARHLGRLETVAAGPANSWLGGAVVGPGRLGGPVIGSSIPTFPMVSLSYVFPRPDLHAWILV